MADADAQDSFSGRLKLFVDSPFIWGAIGMLVGAIVGVIPLSYFFVFAWFLILVALMRAKFFEGLKSWKVIVGNIVLAVVAAFVVIVGYKYCPKPPTLDETATAIANRMPPQRLEISQTQPPSQPQVMHSPVYLKSASADDIADAVLKKLPPTMNPQPTTNPQQTAPAPLQTVGIPPIGLLRYEGMTLVGEIDKWADSRLKDVPASLPPEKKAQEFRDLVDSEWKDRFDVWTSTTLNAVGLAQGKDAGVPHACRANVSFGEGGRGLIETRKTCARYIEQTAGQLNVK